jgi:hypothetical protein
MSQTTSSNRAKKRTSNPVKGQPVQAYYARRNAMLKPDQSTASPSSSLDDEINLFRDLLRSLFLESNLEPEQLEILIKLIGALGLATLRLARLMQANRDLKEETDPGDMLDYAVDELLKFVLPFDKKAGF